MKLEKVSTIITGGGSGLGEATARLLAAAGAKVAVFDIDIERADAVAAAISGLALAVDVSDEVSVASALDVVASEHGDARILVNCAGVGTASRIVGREGPQSLAQFKSVIDVNLVGTFNMMRLVADRLSQLAPMEDGARGAFVNTASVAAFEGQIGQAAYAASKGGIVSMTLPAAREFAQFGIRVNVVAPGIFLTPMLNNLPKEAQDSLAAGIPFPKRLGLPEDFAQTVKFCIENKYLNGETIRLDGGTRLAPR